ncbi:MAG: protein translocase subunit SecD [bacterium]|nr:protein translocase subunit SecD [bacterium]
MPKKFLKPIILTAVAVLLVFFVYPQFLNFSFLPNVPFRLGLDLVGGTHLVYEADLSGVIGDKGDAMEGVRDVIERRVNIFGVSEPLVQVEGESRLVVELAGIQDINQAIKLIGETPFLDFREERPQDESQAILDAQAKGERLDEDPYFVPTRLTGRYLKSASVVFEGGGSGIGPQVSIEFNDEGASLFGQLTKDNIGKRLAIYLDGIPISTPVVQDEITAGSAVISGNFTPDEAKELAIRLNAGALPVAINLISQQTIGASLGQESLSQSLRAGVYGLILVALFMIVFYRLPGLVSVFALIIYVLIILALYKAIPVTLTLAGIAGFILSLGIAVDANILIFARMREELADGKTLTLASNEGFKRAWMSIRDSHVTAILGALILYLFTTSFIKGFALTLGIGVLLSLFTATVVTRAFLELFINPKFEKWKWLFR